MMPDPADIFILARSGRALAQSARAPDWRPWVVDGFGDVDTRDCAAGVVKVRITRDGLSEAGVADALDMLALKARPGGPAPLLPGSPSGYGRAGLIYGSGVEAMPALLDRLADRFEIIGNGADVIRAVKDPPVFFATLTALGIAYPVTRFTAPEMKRHDGMRGISGDSVYASAHEWLVKRAAGSGGEHVRRWRGRAIDDSQRYYQHFLPGPAMSALFVADGRRAQVLGYNTLWRARHAGSPFAYGGAINRAKLSPSQRQLIANHVHALTAAFGLRGLNSLDFMVHHGQPRVLEINPRPGATCELYEPEAPAGMLALHTRGCRRQLPGDSCLRGFSEHGPRAQVIVYADKAYQVPLGLRWPHWCRDLPAPGAAIPTHAPICTVLAEGDAFEQVSRLAGARRDAVLNSLAATSIAA
ncbi:MAG: ATP-grasp domain-containing protein [Gammaproteobacteria bacterium]|nr:ATP-grasp domain-containing protein [Gammaproteobacteria bacterium]